jgi:GT2 family glycosyltransferase
MIAGASPATSPAQRRMSVSVVIPTYNRIASLMDVLDALRRQTLRDFEVIVVDGPSTDGTAERLDSLGGAVRHLQNPERNLSRSRNLGIAAAAGELVAFLDDDAVPEPRWLEDLVAAFDHDRVAGAGGLVLDDTGVREQWRHLVVSRAGAHDFDQEPPFDRFVGPGADPFLYVAGGNCAFRRSALAEIDGFDEEIEYNFDEAEACLRLLDAGWLLRSLESAVVHHRQLPSHQRSAAAFTDPFTEVKNLVYFGLRNAPERAAALIVANRRLAELRSAARRAAREGRLSDVELARYLGRADAGFHAGLRRGADAQRRGRPIGPADPTAFRRYPTLAPSPRRRVALTDPDRARALAAEGHEVHRLAVVAADEAHRIDFDDGVWVHAVPAAPRWLPELDGSPWRARLEEAAAVRGALAAARGGEPLEVEVELPPPLDGFLGADRAALERLLVGEAALSAQDAVRVAARLCEDDRFPVDYERAVRPCLALEADERCVECLYEALLARAPEPLGRAAWVRALAAGEERRAVVERIARSTEARRRGVDPAFVARLPPGPRRRRSVRRRAGRISARLFRR